MEKYIGQCLDSLLIPEIDEVDVIIVNDGSKDRSSEIAHNYADQYPDSIRVVDKPNGHYGSCINAALSLANGRYVRILDADDWFNSKSFSFLIKELRNLDVDVVFTNNSVCHEANGLTEQNIFEGMTYGQILNLDSFIIPKKCLKMHCLTYRTDLLKQICYRQTEGICYTDNEYVVVPLLHARTLWATDYSLYQYRIGRNEQSVSIQSIVKNVDHYIMVLNRLTEYNAGDSKRNEEIKIPILIRLLYIVFDVFCLFRVCTNEQMFRIKMINSIIESKHPMHLESLYRHRIKHLPLYKLWYNHNLFYYNVIFPIIKSRKSISN